MHVFSSRAGFLKLSDSEWNSDQAIPWHDDVSTEAEVQLASIATDWRIQRSEIQICKNANGGDLLLGNSTSGKVLHPSRLCHCCGKCNIY